MAESIRENDRKLKVQKDSEKKELKKKENKALSDEEKQIEQTAAKEKISREEAKKKVARAAVKKETGYDADTLARVGKEALDTKDAMEKPAEVGHTTEALQRMHGEAVKDMLGKIEDKKMAENVVNSGLGAMHASTGAGGLSQGARTVLENEAEIGGGAGMEELLRQAVLYGNGMTLAEVKELKMTPDRLKDYVAQLKENKTSPAKKDLPPEALKKMGPDR